MKPEPRHSAPSPLWYAVWVPVPEVIALAPALDQARSTAVDELLPLIYGDLRRLAARHLRQERGSHTLQTTALAHEAYIRLVDQSRVAWQGRPHVMSVAAELIRRVLVDHARARCAQKRGGGRDPVGLSGLEIPEPDAADVTLIDLHEALVELGQLSARQARVVELKYFGGLENQEVARAMGISETLVKNEWRFARVWLAERLRAYAMPGSR